MKATIWHNPNCGTSRKVLAMLESEPGIELEVVQYLKTPPSREKLASLYERAGMSPRHGLRTHNSPAADLCAELGLLEANGETILDAMMAHPVLIERPLVETEKGVRLGRPPEAIREIL